jgi:hypothetical protein
MASGTIHEPLREARRLRAAQICIPVLSAAVLTGCILLHYYAPAQLHLPPCVFHEVTGLYCPGCGAARALHHLMKGELLAALRSNLLFVLALPVLVCAFSLKALRAMGVAGVNAPRISLRASWAITAIVIGWWVVRNLPFEFFRIPS